MSKWQILSCMWANGNPYTPYIEVETHETTLELSLEVSENNLPYNHNLSVIPFLDIYPHVSLFSITELFTYLYSLLFHSLYQRNGGRLDAQQLIDIKLRCSMYTQWNITHL